MNRAQPQQFAQIIFSDESRAPVFVPPPAPAEVVAERIRLADQKRARKAALRAKGTS